MNRHFREKPSAWKLQRAVAERQCLGCVSRARMSPSERPCCTAYADLPYPSTARRDLCKGERFVAREVPVRIAIAPKAAPFWLNYLTANWARHDGPR